MLLEIAVASHIRLPTFHKPNHTVQSDVSVATCCGTLLIFFLGYCQCLRPYNPVHTVYECDVFTFFFFTCVTCVRINDDDDDDENKINK